MTATRAPVAIALHSSGAGARQWAPYQTLVDPDWQWQPIDLLGYGDAPVWPVGGAVSLDAEARNVMSLIDGACGAPVHLVGHSYGGAVALQVALTWPEKVASLTLYEPVRFALLRDFDPEAWREILRTGRWVGMLALAGHLHESANAFVDYWSGEGSWQRLSPTRREAIAQRMPKVQAEFEALFGDPVPASSYGALAGIPLRLVCGSTSPAPARRVADRLAMLTQAELIPWSGADHLAPLTQVERFARQLPCAGAGGVRQAA